MIRRTQLSGDACDDPRPPRPTVEWLQETLLRLKLRQEESLAACLLQTKTTVRPVELSPPLPTRHVTCGYGGGVGREGRMEEGGVPRGLCALFLKIDGAVYPPRSARHQPCPAIFLGVALCRLHSLPSHRRRVVMKSGVRDIPATNKLFLFQPPPVLQI